MEYQHVQELHYKTVKTTKKSTYKKHASISDYLSYPYQMRMYSCCFLDKYSYCIRRHVPEYNQPLNSI